MSAACARVQGEARCALAAGELAFSRGARLTAWKGIVELGSWTEHTRQEIVGARPYLRHHKALELSPAAQRYLVHLSFDLQCVRDKRVHLFMHRV